MPVSNTPNRNYPAPGATITDRRLADMQAVRAAIHQIDNDVQGLVPKTTIGVANGLASLGPDAKILASQLPALTITDTYTVNSEAEMLALVTAEKGDIAVRSDLSKSFILKGLDPSVLADWQELLSPTSAVQSVNGLVGAVSLNTSNIPEAGNLYFTNMRAAAAAPVQSVAGKTGAVVLEMADLPSDVGTKHLPQVIKNTDYTLGFDDSGKQVLHPSSDTTARIYTIPSNQLVALKIGTAFTFINQNGAGNLTIAIATDVMRLAGTGATGNRTLAANGVATALKITDTEWIISGTGLT